VKPDVENIPRTKARFDLIKATACSVVSILVGYLNMGCASRNSRIASRNSHHQHAAGGYVEVSVLESLHASSTAALLAQLIPMVRGIK
jgi:hypothetical protein